jgi:hypothetical protein
MLPSQAYGASPSSLLDVLLNPHRTCHLVIDLGINILPVSSLSVPKYAYNFSICLVANCWDLFVL